MTREEKFKDAQVRVKTLTKRPSNDQLLELYSLYKQGTEGDVKGKRPGMFDLKGRTKFDAWSGRKGMSKEDAMDAYILLVERMVG